MDPKLREIAKSGNVHLLRLLLEQKPDILHEVNIIGNTTLHLVTIDGKKNIVAEIYNQFPPNVIMQNAFGDTPLHIAARNGSLSVVDYLIEKIISNTSGSHDEDIESSSGGGGRHGLHDVLAKGNKLKNTALHEALQYKQQDVAKLLIKKDPELCSLVNDAGESPLYMAASHGLASIVHQILQSSQPHADGGPNGLTALHAAAREGHTGCLEELVKEKQELVTMKDDCGRTPLHYAVTYYSKKRNLKPSAVGLLLQADRSIGYLQDRDCQTPLHIAASGVHLKLVKKLLKWCPDSIYQVNGRGRNILHIVMRDCNDEYYSHKIFEHLLQRVEVVGILNQPDQDGNTPLHLAAITHDQYFMEILKKDERVDRSVINKKNMTAQETMDDRLFIENKIIKLKKKEDRQRNNSTENSNSLEDSVEEENEEIVLAKEEREKRREELSQTHLIVATLIAGISSDAVFRIPGIDGSGRTKQGLVAASKVYVASFAIALSSSMSMLYLHFDAVHRRRMGSGSVPDYHSVTTSLMFISIIGVMVACMTGSYISLKAMDSFWFEIFIMTLIGIMPIVASSTVILGYGLGFIRRHISTNKALLNIIIAVVAIALTLAGPQWQA
ncbi:protein ACCELERATED CELL DEATH 6-like [Telopea speciosissima]|uniref:protein ACCELERATED CELL DEATH 6-like n=1 Tax=Telopea speciosissima TaxID=54955 RepID=UPI001CC440A7|nr:protein ACCELERATED CELL DEATH 6-like [Telopea speciosissima]